MKLIGVLVGLSACDAGPSCKDAVTKASAVIGEAHVGPLTAKCEKQAWSADARRCLADITDRMQAPDCINDRSRELRLARVRVMDFALDAYTQWAGSHRAACPGSLRELDEYMSTPGMIDPWGHEYVMLCGAKLPNELKGRGIGISSDGQDGKHGTDDDITSWEWDWTFPDYLQH